MMIERKRRNKETKKYRGQQGKTAYDSVIIEDIGGRKTKHKNTKPTQLRGYLAGMPVLKPTYARVVNRCMVVRSVNIPRHKTGRITQGIVYHASGCSARSNDRENKRHNESVEIAAPTPSSSDVAQLARER